MEHTQIPTGICPELDALDEAPVYVATGGGDLPQGWAVAIPDGVISPDAEDHAKWLVSADPTFMPPQASPTKHLGAILHVSADRWLKDHPSYNASANYDPKAKTSTVRVNVPPGFKGAHTLGRNSFYGLCANGGLGGIWTKDLDLVSTEYPIQRLQIERLACHTAEFLLLEGLDPRGTVTVGKIKAVGNSYVSVPGTITMPVLSGHIHWANVDGYKGWRLDAGKFVDAWIKATLYYFDKKKAGLLPFEQLGQGTWPNVKGIYHR